jgi:hypothetical protein
MSTSPPTSVLLTAAPLRFGRYQHIGQYPHNTQTMSVMSPAARKLTVGLSKGNTPEDEAREPHYTLYTQWDEQHNGLITTAMTPGATEPVATLLTNMHGHRQFSAHGHVPKGIAERLKADMVNQITMHLSAAAYHTLPNYMAQRIKQTPWLIKPARDVRNWFRRVTRPPVRRRSAPNGTYTNP